MDSLAIGIWNTQWRKPLSDAGKLIRERLEEAHTDILCISEGFEALLPNNGYVITSGEDYGYPIKEGRRKVLLWSRYPWVEVDPIGSLDLPQGRFIRGTTSTPIGAITVVGVCIPWADAHVSTGKRNRQKWEDHLAYLDALQVWLGERVIERSIVVGDYNQAIPARKIPRAVSEKLQQVFNGNFQIATTGLIPNIGSQIIDHLAHTKDLSVVSIEGWEKQRDNGLQLSDHFGVKLTLTNSK